MKKILFFFPLIILASCTKDEGPSLPVLTTSNVVGITQTTAVSGGNISDNGGAEILSRGICFATYENPDILSSKTNDGPGTGTFMSTLTELLPNTPYYVRAYATNIAGTGYGNQLMFTTSQVEPWMLLPYFALPSTGLSLMVGQEVTIFGDALVNVPIENNLQVTYTCDIGTQSGNNFIINPLAGNTGNHSLTVTVKNNGFLVTTKTITLTVFDKSSPKNKKILLIGDSTIPPDIYGIQITSVLNNSTFTFLGTIGTTYKYEGYDGASWSGFINGTFGKFTKSGVLNIPAYFADYSIPTPDYVYIRLGINDTFAGCVIGEDGLTDAEILSIISTAKTLINAFLSYNAGLKIILGIPTISENSGNGWNANYDENIYSQDLYIQNMHKYWTAFIATFANGSFNTRVDCSYEAIFLDRDNGYPKSNGVHINGVHPHLYGQEQLGKGIAVGINKLMKTE